MIVRVCKTFKFCGAHRIYAYPGNCSGIHGHNFLVSVVLAGRASDLNDLGLLTDFRAMSDEFKTWLDDRLDHATILCDKDPLIEMLERQGTRVYVLPKGLSASSECLAGHLLATFSQIAEDDPERFRGRVLRVRVQETDTAWAEAEREESPGYLSQP